MLGQLAGVAEADGGLDFAAGDGEPLLMRASLVASIVIFSKVSFTKEFMALATKCSSAARWRCRWP